MYTNVREMLEEKMSRAYQDGAAVSTFHVGTKLIILENVRRIGACLLEKKTDPEWEEFVKRVEARVSEAEVLEKAREEAVALQAWRDAFARTPHRKY